MLLFICLLINIIAGFLLFFNKKYSNSGAKLLIIGGKAVWCGSQGGSFSYVMKRLRSWKAEDQNTSHIGTGPITEHIYIT